MRQLILTIFLLACASLAPAVVSATYDVSGYPQVSIGGGLALTSTETTITLTKSGVTGRVVQITCDQPWGIATATGAYAAKQPMSANQAYTFTDNSDRVVFYVQAASTSGTLRVSVIQTLPVGQP